jgi:hypothetical protein
MRLKGHAEFSRLRAFLFCLPLFASGGCFDYTETIFFGADLSGHVDLDYTVPLRAGSDDPLISHFLVQEGEIEKRLSILLGRKADIHDFTKDIKVDQHGARHARVQFKVTFRSPPELERILIGKNRVYFYEGRWIIQRTFPASKPLSGEASRIARRIRELARLTLSDHNLSFLVVYPEQYDLYTNQGTIVRPGVQSLTLPLSATMNGTPMVWTMEIKANPRPQVFQRIR